MIKIIVSGRVGNDAQIKSVGDTTVCSFSVAHSEKVYGENEKEKTTWVAANIWGERGVKLAPHILKGTFVVIEGSAGVNAYMKDGQPNAMINCRVNSLEFGGKPTTNTPATNTEPEPAKYNRLGVAMEEAEEDLPF